MVTGTSTRGMSKESSNVRFSGRKVSKSPTISNCEANENELGTPLNPIIHYPRSRSPLNTIADPGQFHFRRHSFSERKLDYGIGTPPRASGRTATTDSEMPHFELQQDSSFWADHNVQVLIRIRPLSGTERASQGHARCLRQESSQTLVWLGHPETRFTFDHVASHTISQVLYAFQTSNFKAYYVCCFVMYCFFAFP